MHPSRPYEQDRLVGEDFPLSNTKSATLFSYCGESLTNQFKIFGTSVSDHYKGGGFIYVLSMQAFKTKMRWNFRLF